MNISLLAALLSQRPYFFTSSSTGNSTGNAIDPIENFNKKGMSWAA